MNEHTAHVNLSSALVLSVLTIQHVSYILCHVEPLLLCHLFCFPNRLIFGLFSYWQGYQQLAYQWHAPRCQLYLSTMSCIVAVMWSYMCMRSVYLSVYLLHRCTTVLNSVHWTLTLTPFVTVDALCTMCIVRYCYRKSSVCPSVCPSVTLRYRGHRKFG